MARDPLSTYQAKRDFSRTSEPEGSKAARKASKSADRKKSDKDGDGSRDEARFVVQRHRATARHYDFRLEVDGVLASWAVPKGPTLDPEVKSLAVHVEDHPIEYFDFEGVIPRGEYGGGDVIVWDWGTWTPTNTDDPGTAIPEGEIHFDLRGEKLAGRFALVRTRRRQGNKEQWLLIKKHDDAARSGWNPEDHPASVKTGRTNDEVAADPDCAVARRQAGRRGRGVPRPGSTAKPTSKWAPANVGSSATARTKASKAATTKPPGTDTSATGTRPDKRTGTKRAPERKRPPHGRRQEERQQIQGRTKSRSGPTATQLRKLDHLGGSAKKKDGAWTIHATEVKLTNLDKVLFPADATLDRPRSRNGT